MDKQLHDSQDDYDHKNEETEFHHQPSPSIEAERESDAHAGVKRVEAAEKVYGRYSKWVLFISCVLCQFQVPPSEIMALGLVSRRTFTHWTAQQHILTLHLPPQRFRNIVSSRPLLLPNPLFVSTNVPRLSILYEG